MRNRLDKTALRAVGIFVVVSANTIYGILQHAEKTKAITDGKCFFLTSQQAHSGEKVGGEQMFTKGCNYITRLNLYHDTIKRVL